MAYIIMVADNFHYMDQSETYRHSVVDSGSIALEICKRIVDDFLLSAFSSEESKQHLYESYKMFGEDPYIVTTDGSERCDFSAWDYAREQCKQIERTYGLNSTGN